MRPRDKKRAAVLDAAFIEHGKNTRLLPGIQDPAARATLVEQLIESIRRSEFLEVLVGREMSKRRDDPSAPEFDPLRAAVVRNRAGDVDDACWLVFLATHFGRNLRTSWSLVRAFYGRLDDPKRWDWKHASQDPSAVRTWVHEHRQHLRASGQFGNHRKYESLRDTPAGTGAVLASYINWVSQQGGHKALFESAMAKAKGDRKAAFDFLYRAMQSVTRFGRTGRFDYLTMIGNCQIVPLEPGMLYLTGATGPRRGSRLLFGGSVEAEVSNRNLEQYAAALAANINVPMNVLEDALCNWQKSPARFLRFRG
jgi:Alpha-glutamyl/putrescinyl thymine pyrophosphorylase clade 3